MDDTKIATKVNRCRPATRHLATVACALLIFAAFGRSVALGANVTLTDRNSTVNFETGTINGMKDWLVDGVDQLFRQWIWYRVGTGGPEQPINTLDHNDLADVNVSDDDLDAGNEHLLTRYVDPNGDFEIQVDYLLTGGALGSGTSGVAEVISVINNLNAPLDFHLFRYTDLDLGSTTDDAFVEILDGHTARQRDVGAGPGVFTTEVETVVTPTPSHAEVGRFSDLPNIIGRLQDGDSDDLDDDPLALFGADDYLWAFQWDVVIPDGGTFLNSTVKNSSLVPEPSLPGDYNFNLVVDAADYTVWANTFGQMGPDLPADGNGNLIVDAADYTIWANNFGDTAVGPSPAPEPSTFALSTLGLLGLLTYGWLRRSRA